MTWVCALAAIGGCGRQSGPPSAVHARHDVTLRKIAFTPAIVSAATGDTVVWRNDDLVPHTVSARDRSWDSGNLPPDSSWRLIVPVPAGDSLRYGCRYHPGMQGVVVVTRSMAGHSS